MVVVDRDGPVPAPREPAGVDPAAEEHQDRGQHRERSDHGDEHGGHPAVPEGAQEVLREDQQRRHRGGHGQPGEQHRAAGGRHGHPDRLPGRLRVVVGQLASSSRNRLITNSA